VGRYPSEEVAKQWLFLYVKIPIRSIKTLHYPKNEAQKRIGFSKGDIALIIPQ
jgi:hypothetical protein